MKLSICYLFFSGGGRFFAVVFVLICKKARAAANIDFATALLNKRRKILFFSVKRRQLYQNDG